MRDLGVFWKVLAVTMFLMGTMLTDAEQAQGADETARKQFLEDFEEKYKGEYILNPSPSCQPIRKSTKIRVDMIQNDDQPVIRVTNFDQKGKQVGSKLYPIKQSQITMLNSKSKEPNSLLWETNIRDQSAYVVRTGTAFERMTFNAHALSFDVLKTRDPIGMFSFFRSSETLSETRCNFTRIELMNATPEQRREYDRKRRAPTR